MENLGPKLNGALLVLKQFGLHKCGHEGKPVTAAKCILSMIGSKNKNHYLIGTQDRDLQDKIRKLPGVPLVYLHSKTPVLDPPSYASQEYVKNALAGVFESEKRALKELRLKGGVNEEERSLKKKKKKCANPLSCLKKQKIAPQVNKIEKKITQAKRRKRIRIPNHVKLALIDKIKSQD